MSTQNDWEKQLSSLIDDTIENRHEYKGPLVVEDDILFERLNENLKPFVKTLLADAEKAYGGCHKCYGKGYSTVRYGLRSSSDFEGDKEYIDPIKTNIHFCDCDRGKQIEKLLADARKEMISKVESLPQYWDLDGDRLCVKRSDVLATLKEEQI